jgi:hypothetical protein
MHFSAVLQGLFSWSFSSHSHQTGFSVDKEVSLLSLFNAFVYIIINISPIHVKKKMDGFVRSCPDGAIGYM